MMSFRSRHISRTWFVCLFVTCIVCYRKRKLSYLIPHITTAQDVIVRRRYQLKIEIVYNLIHAGDSLARRGDGRTTQHEDELL